MALATFDGEFSFSQETVARLGDRAGTSKLTEEQQRQLKQSKAFQAQVRVDELLKEYSEERDKKRAALDQAFTPDEVDFSASKAFDYDRSVNYYEVLGIDEYEPLDEVNRAYKRLSLVYHPDKTKGMSSQQQQDYETIFISVKNAHLVLGDQATRRQYDKDRDHDRAKELVSGVKAQKSQHVDLTEVLKRISEMQRPPGKNVEVTLQMELEHFFYGVHKVIPRNRRVKDFYAGMVTQEHLYRLHVERGAAEPVEISFKEQGDHNADARPDTVTFSVTSRPHEILERSGDDLIRREEIQLGPGSLTEAYFQANLSSLRGRQLLLWGQNPFFPSWRSHSPASHLLNISVLSEGLSNSGRLHFRCRFSAAETKVFSKDESRRFLKDLVAAKEAVDNSGVWDPVFFAQSQRMTPAELHRTVGAAVQAISGEWHLIAKAVRLLHVGQCDFARFTRNNLEESKQNAPEDLDEAACAWQRALGGARHGQGGACNSSVMSARAKRAVCESEILLQPFGEELQLFTQPPCSLRFYSNLLQLHATNCTGVPPRAVFAVCLGSQTCASVEAQPQWSELQEKLLPLLECSIFQLLQAARGHQPLCVADFPARNLRSDPSPAGLPWKQLGTEAFRQGDFWLAANYYSKWLEDLVEPSEKAIAHSNRAACFAKVKDFEGSMADAQAAKELRPTWARVWSRLGIAAEGLQDLKEAIQAYRHAVELDPSPEHLEALGAVAVHFDGEADVEKTNGDAAFAATPPNFGLATAFYTVAIALHPAAVPMKELEALASKEKNLLESENRINAEEKFREAVEELRQATASKDVSEVAALYGNRAAALCHLRRWSPAVQDARMAVRLQRDSAKARCRLGVALLGAGLPEEAYVEFAWALAIDSHYSSARSGLEACLTSIPKWRSRMAQRSERLLQDRGRPRAFAKVWLISDLYYDHKANAEWCQDLDDSQFQDDVLIVAGNVADTLRSVMRGLKALKEKFRRVFYVPGNRDLALNASEVRTARFPDSIAKFLALLSACEEIGVEVFPGAVGQDVYVVPLFSWYSAEFDKRSRPDPNVGFDAQCVWPLDHHQLWKWMLKLNEAHLRLPYRGTVLTTSHFVPLTTLPYDSTGKQAQAMGCEEIEDQVRILRSSAHAYGHSSMRSLQVHGGTAFANHALGIASDENEVPERPLLLFDGANGVVKGNGS
ncbi:Hsp70-Hsp90 organizing protein 3 (AtHop3) [Durusdinium trenchii]|uniref:Hsp70-Hsp90 organizing protein 3 (AtHop3) n=1 Tax=Durusdinium trenchii TaxID=1381693 RepID=A0ABP0HMQ4_9DINO